MKNFISAKKADVTESFFNIGRISDGIGAPVILFFSSAYSTTKQFLRVPS